MDEANRGTRAFVLPARVVAIVAEAEIRFETKIRLGRTATQSTLKARHWIMEQCLAEGFGIGEIAAFFSTSSAAIKAVLRIPPAMEVDDDEHDDIPLRTKTGMLPIYGDRKPCANESACLGDLLRACAPRAPRYASCPRVCLSYVPMEPMYVPSGGQWNDHRYPSGLDREQVRERDRDEMPESSRFGEDSPTLGQSPDHCAAA